MSNVVAAIKNALTAAGLSQRALANATDLSQPTINRILTGDRTPKMTDIILIADATGCTVAQLTGTGVADTVRCAARSVNGSTMDEMHQRLLHFMELDAYLDNQAIPAR